MKNFTFTIIFLFIYVNNFAQIISNGIASYSITIKPIGLYGRLSYSPILQSSTNTALGGYALSNLGDVTNNTAIGYQTLLEIHDNLTNSYNGSNTAVGVWALKNDRNGGFDNSAFGVYCMAGGNGVVSGTGNSAFGREAMSYHNSGNDNTAFGVSALYHNATGNDNTIFGNYAASANISSNNNTAGGDQSLFNHTTGDNNAAFGSGTMYYDESGTDNAAFGFNALGSNISGNYNTAFGQGALFSNKTANSNVAIGYTSLLYCDEQSNIAIGRNAQYQNISGSRNVVVGYNAFPENQTGSRNVSIGDASGGGGSENDKLYIGTNFYVDNNTSTTLIWGDFATRKVCIACNTFSTGGANGFYTRTEAFQVQGTAFKTLGNGSWQFPSDKRLKANIISLNRNEILSNLLQMQGVNYTLIANPEQGLQYGFIAQDLRKVFPTKILENKAGFLSASYGDFVPMFVEAIKALNERVEKLEQNKPNIKAMTARVEEMEKIFTAK